MYSSGESKGNRNGRNNLNPQSHPPLVNQEHTAIPIFFKFRHWERDVTFCFVTSRDHLVTRHLRRVPSRLQMSHDEVCTSDPDELEIILAGKPDYWRRNENYLYSPRVEDGASRRSTQTPAVPSSQSLDDSPRPRKRVKVCSANQRRNGWR